MYVIRDAVNRVIVRILLLWIGGLVVLVLCLK